MKRNILFSLFFVVALIPFTSAQQEKAKITIKNTSYDFGVIKEENGVVSANFEIENTSQLPLVIQRVISTCNCTTPEWVKEPITPGAKSVIKVKYDPKGRPGVFSQTITVYSNAETPTLVLQIKGKVQERQKTIEEIYNRAIGDLRFTSSNISFNRVFVNKIVTDTLEFMNLTEAPVKVGCNLNGQTHLSVRIIPESVKPKEKGLMIVSFDAKKRNDWGFVNDRITLTQNDKEVPNGFISVNASIEDDYSNLSEDQLMNAPKIEFKSTICNFNQVDEGNVVEYNFEFKNTGKSNLLIHKIKPGCGCTTINPSENVIKPGDSTSFKATFRTNGYSGRVTKSITVISNDPKTPTVVLQIVGVVNNPGKK